MDLTLVLMIIGFVLASYSIVANDAIQTLGTFLSSNSHRPWWVLWLFACSVLTAVFVYGWIANQGDVSYCRLKKFPLAENIQESFEQVFPEIPYDPEHPCYVPPEEAKTAPAFMSPWILVIPPLILLFLTRAGIPVSTTFLILTVFAPGNLQDMMIKSGLGYLVAFIVGLTVYRMVTQKIEKRFWNARHETPGKHWVALQWCSTGFLWSQWLIQDLANIFTYLPRQLPAEALGAALLLMLALHAFVFKNRGGKLQAGIVLTKTNTTDIRSATVIDFIYGLILFVFKELSDIPMSTTWVFLGLLAGRELGLVLAHQWRSLRDVSGIIGSDAAKVLFGLLISVLLAFGLPLLANLLTGGAAVAAGAP